MKNKIGRVHLQQSVWDEKPLAIYVTTAFNRYIQITIDYPRNYAVEVNRYKKVYILLGKPSHPVISTRA